MSEKHPAHFNLEHIAAEVDDVSCEISRHVNLVDASMCIVEPALRARHAQLVSIVRKLETTLVIQRTILSNAGWENKLEAPSYLLQLHRTKIRLADLRDEVKALLTQCRHTGEQMDAVIQANQEIQKLALELEGMQPVNDLLGGFDCDLEAEDTQPW